MKVVLPNTPQGFCFGVKRAIERVQNQAKQGKVQVLGLLVHNLEVTSSLSKSGIQTINDLSDATADTIAITAHGSPCDIYNGVPGKTLIDTTCPFVSRLQRRASELSKEGFKVVIVGDVSHPEVVSVASFAKEPAVVADTEQAKNIGHFPKIAVLSQTTQQLEQLQVVACELLLHCDILLFENTICPSTKERQEEVARLAKECGVVVVVGGKVSANTYRLSEIAKQKGARTFWIESPRDLTTDLLEEVRLASLPKGQVGVISGASTPLSSFQDVVSALENYDPKT